MSATDSRFAGLEQGNSLAGLRWTRGREISSAFAMLFIGWAILAWPWLSGHVSIPWDAKAHFLPQLQFLAANFASGDSPFWAPFVFSGHPQIADPQSLIFSPPFVVLAYLDPAPTPYAADLTVFALLLLSAAAMLRWLIDKGVQPVAALLAALSFIFGAAMAWRIQHIGQVMSLAYLPIVLLMLDRALIRRSVSYAIGAGIAAACLVLGRDQVALLSVYFLIAYVANHWLLSRDAKAEFVATLKPLVIATLTGACIIAIPLMLTLLVAADSNRPSIDVAAAGRGSLHPALGLTLFAPDVFGSSGATGRYWGPPSMSWSGTGLYLAQNMGQLYMGALPALLLILGAVSGRIWKRDCLVYSASLVAATLFALGWYTPVFQLFHALIPGIDLYRRPADAVFLIGFLGSVLAGRMLDKVLRHDGETVILSRAHILATIAIILIVFSTMIALALHFEMLTDAWPAIVIPFGLFVAAALVLATAKRFASDQAIYVAPLIAALLVGDLAWSNRPGGATGLPPKLYSVLDTASTDDTIVALKQLTRNGGTETRRDRIEIVGFGFIWPNASLTHRLENTLGYNPLRLGNYSRATGAGDHVGLASQKNFSPLFPSYRSQLADQLGLRYIATSEPIETIDKKLKPGDLDLVARTSRGYIYENRQAVPRVVFATAAHSADFDAIVRSGHWPNVDLATDVLLADAAPSGRRAAGEARIVSYANTRIVLEANSPEGGWLVLHDIWQPWWFAAIDGGDTQLQRANVLFRAVAVPPGRHTVTMTFEPLRGALQQVFGSK